jgi:hypothetical protein
MQLNTNTRKKAIDETPDIPPDEYKWWVAHLTANRYLLKYDITFTGIIMETTKELIEMKLIKLLNKDSKTVKMNYGI